MPIADCQFIGGYRPQISFSHGGEWKALIRTSTLDLTYRLGRKHAILNVTRHDSKQYRRKLFRSHLQNDFAVGKDVTQTCHLCRCPALNIFSQSYRLTVCLNTGREVISGLLGENLDGYTRQLLFKHRSGIVPD